MTHLRPVLILSILSLLPFIPATNSQYQDREFSAANTFTAGCWAAPSVPVLSDPAPNSHVNHLHNTFVWQPSVDPCNSESGLDYQIVISRDVLFTDPVYRSVWQKNTFFDFQFPSDGIYYWRVQSSSSQSNFSPISPVWKLTVDTVKPDSRITVPCNSDHDNDIQYIYLWNGKVSGSSSDNLAGVDHVELSVQRMILDLFWDGSRWVSDSHARVSLGVSGPDNFWSYDFLNRPPLGVFKIVSHAVDRAGNIENSAVIIINNSDTLPPLPMSLNSSYDHQTNIITLTVNNIDQPRLDYEIIYQTDSGRQGIAGTITGQSDFVRSFFLGSCSGSVCTPHTLVSPSVITVTVGDRIQSLNY